MAAWTSQRAGNWSTDASNGSSPWNGGGNPASGVPGNGDTVTLAHNVTVDVNTTVGSSPATGGTAAIATSSSVGGLVLTIAAGVTLRVRGPIQLDSDSDASGHQQTISGQAGAQLIIDPASGQQYTIHGNRNWFVNMTGTSGSHCSVSTDKTRGGLATYITVPSFRSAGLSSVTYTDFSDFGDSTHFGLQGWAWFATGLPNFSITNCTFTRCSWKWSTGGQGWTGTFTFSSNVFSSSTAITTDGGFSNVCAEFSWNASDNSTMGAQFISNNGFDLIVFLSSRSNNTTFQSNSFQGSIGCASSCLWTSFTGNLIYTNVDTTNVYADVTNSYFIHYGASNPHGLGMKNASAGQTFNGVICECPTAAVDGDLIFPGAGAFTWIVKNCILLANINGKSPGKLISCLAFSGSYPGTIVSEHNTAISTDIATNIETGVLNYGEGGTGKAGMISSFKSNLAYTPVGKNAGCLYNRYAGAVQDACAAANAVYNGKFGLATGLDGVGYYSEDATHAFTGTPGANDVVANPNFVDSTRNVATWGQTTQGADGTVTGALAKIAANPALIYDTNNPSALWQWVRAGFAPTNPAYHNTAHDGTDIGAVPWKAGATGNAFFGMM